mmetsp:Transcript_30013/g.75716  ORF Transcript_30013/g.75716 Transcript_30013/m.75716 type:complete len:388 (-) Transcript_30013:153-1316(-)
MMVTEPLEFALAVGIKGMVAQRRCGQTGEVVIEALPTLPSGRWLRAMTATSPIEGLLHRPGVKGVAIDALAAPQGGRGAGLAFRLSVEQPDCECECGIWAYCRDGTVEAVTGRPGNFSRVGNRVRYAAGDRLEVVLTPEGHLEARARGGTLWCSPKVASEELRIALWVFNHAWAPITAATPFARNPLVLLHEPRLPTPVLPDRCAVFAREHERFAMAFAERFMAEVRADAAEATAEVAANARATMGLMRARFQTEMQAAAEENALLAQRERAALEAQEATREQFQAEVRFAAEEQAVAGHRLELQLRTALRAYEADAQAAAEVREDLKLEVHVAEVERQQAHESEEIAQKERFGLQEELASAEERMAHMVFAEQHMDAWQEEWIIEG